MFLTYYQSLTMISLQSIDCVIDICVIQESSTVDYPICCLINVIVTNRKRGKPKSYTPEIKKVKSVRRAWSHLIEIAG